MAKLVPIDFIADNLIKYCVGNKFRMRKFEGGTTHILGL